MLWGVMLLYHVNALLDRRERRRRLQHLLHNVNLGIDILEDRSPKMEELIHRFPNPHHHGNLVLLMRLFEVEQRTMENFVIYEILGVLEMELHALLAANYIRILLQTSLVTTDESWLELLGAFWRVNVWHFCFYIDNIFVGKKVR